VTPHWQAPADVQVSAPTPQSTHDAPVAPHVDTDRGLQVEPEQQPSHEVASQTHSPPKQCCPPPQAGPVPHAHLPAEHESAVIESQATHAAPPAPQVASAGVLHVAPEQQPVVHMAAHLLHTPALHASPVGHTVQDIPALPHAAFASPVSHVVPLQQPPEHDVASQMHAPLTHRCPAPHEGTHGHPPLSAHESVRGASRCVSGGPESGGCV
jgi:hypothetical protein